MAERKRPPRLHRRCPACGAVRPASEFRRAGRTPTDPNVWGAPRHVRCPGCGHTGLLLAFVQVDSPAEGGEG
jgi:hypothetical protein